MRSMRTIVLWLLVQSFTSTLCLSQANPPSWARDAVWYQIFPERFRNGDPSNDPTAEELELPPSRPWHISPWTSDWYKLQPWEEVHDKNFYANVFDRRYGGDLQGVIDKLDYLKDLGINAIYLNPIFEAFSLHKYDASTYHHIDNNFGPDAKGDLNIIAQETDDPSTWTWTAADSLFLKLIREAHKRNIRIIIDGVFNHSGTRHWAFQDVVKNQQKSRYADWYRVTRWDDPATPENEFDYKGWWGEKHLPEFNRDEKNLVEPVRRYFFNITKRWMDPNGDGNPADGIDGWRLDVANEIPSGFWREWRGLVKKINPEAIIIGEIWDDAAKWLQGDQFDAVMNYPVARACVRFFIDTGSKRFTPGEFDRELEDIRKSYPAPANYVLQNLLDSHDTDRLPSMVRNPNRAYDRQGSVRENPSYDIGKPTADDVRVQKLVVLFQMTYVGAPMVYYGDETGMWGADDPDDRKPMVWDDLKYDDERTSPIAAKSRTPDRVAFDQTLHDAYKQMIKIRNDNPALRRGTFRKVLTDDSRGIYAFERVDGANDVLVVFNNTWAMQSISVEASGTYEEALSGRVLTSDSNSIRVSLDGKSGAVLIRK